jgi:hypothetical protein
MAGGMSRSTGGVPLRDRVRRDTRPGPDVGPRGPVDRAGEGRHCWVLDAADRHGVKRAGVLLEWRRSVVDGTWEGRVAYAAELRPGRTALVEEWVPAALLEPA